uniref:cPMO2 n=1 Tax=compost metagenome TaxID=702656 RepID=UPI0021825AFC
HGFVSGIVADGSYYGGYNTDEYPYMSNPPNVIAWSTTATNCGFTNGTGYQSPDIICHSNASNGSNTAVVAAGSSIQFQWTVWPASHHGPLITYLAPCGGNCATVDKTTLDFTKIAAVGLVNGVSPPGVWADDSMIADNNTAVVVIPASYAPGNYVLRHEIIALHVAGNNNGAQNYPQCFNIQITGGGSAQGSGVAGTSLYKNTDPGIKFNIYSDLSGGYPIPGPALFA